MRGLNDSVGSWITNQMVLLKGLNQAILNETVGKNGSFHTGAPRFMLNVIYVLESPIVDGVDLQLDRGCIRMHG